MARRRKPATGVTWLVCAVTVLAGCAQTGTVRNIPDDKIPTGLMSATATAASDTLPKPDRNFSDFKVYWATRRLPGMTAPPTPTTNQLQPTGGATDDTDAKIWLTPRRLEKDPPSGNPIVTVQTLLDRLAAGPNADESGDELFTLISAGAELTVQDVTEGTATISLSNLNQPRPNQLPVMVGQIVHTSCQEGLVEQVILQDSQGKVIEIPLPNKTTKSGPVSSRDFSALLWQPSNDIFATADPAD